eukprot:gene3201-5929_t
MIKTVLLELEVWRSILVKPVGSVDLFRKTSFAMTFYLASVTISQFRIHRRLRAKTATLPAIAVITTAHLSPSLFGVVAVISFLWVIASIIIWEYEYQERRRVEARWNNFQNRQNAGVPSRNHQLDLPEKDASSEASKIYSAEHCIICFENFAEGSQPYTLPCGHQAFHKECLSDWFNECGSMRCPMCHMAIDRTSQWLQTVF